MHYTLHTESLITHKPDQSLLSFQPILIHCVQFYQIECLNSPWIYNYEFRRSSRSQAACLGFCSQNSPTKLVIWNFGGQSTVSYLKQWKNVYLIDVIPKEYSSKTCVEIPIAHFLYRLLDGKKTTRSQFSVPGLWEIHRNLKQEKKDNSRESFFRKSPFCTFSCINPGFGGPWGYWNFFVV